MTCKELTAAILVLGIMVLSVHRVQGQPTGTPCADIPECTERFTEAQRLSKSGAHEQALQLFRDIDRQYSDPTALYPIAVMLDRLGRFAEAATAYQSYLNSGVESDPGRLVKIQDQLRQVQAKESHPSTPTILVKKSLPKRMIEDASVLSTPPSMEPVQQAVPVYKRGWFWAVVGGSVGAVAIGVGLGVGLGNRGQNLPDGVNTYAATF